MKSFIWILASVFCFNTFAMPIDFSGINTENSNWQGAVLRTLIDKITDNNINCTGQTTIHEIRLGLKQSERFRDDTNIHLTRINESIQLTVDHLGTIYPGYYNSVRYLYKFIISNDAQEIKSFSFQKGKTIRDNLADQRTTTQNLLMPIGAPGEDTLIMENEISICILTDK